MKKCKHCGALQGDNKTFCIDCGEWLGSPLTKQEKESEERKVTDNITKLYNKKDYFYVNRMDKAVAILLIIGAAVSLLFRIVWGAQFNDLANIILILAIPVMALEAVDLLYPWISWELFKLKFIFSVDNPDDLEPSVIMLYVRRIVAYTTTVCDIIFIICLIVWLIMG